MNNLWGMTPPKPSDPYLPLFLTTPLLSTKGMLASLFNLSCNLLVEGSVATTKPVCQYKSILIQINCYMGSNASRDTSSDILADPTRMTSVSKGCLLGGQTNVCNASKSILLLSILIHSLSHHIPFSYRLTMPNTIEPTSPPVMAEGPLAVIQEVDDSLALDGPVSTPPAGKFNTS